MRVRSDVTVDFGANVGVHQALYYHRFYSQWYGCVVMEYARNGLSHEILFAGDLVLICEFTETLKNKVMKVNITKAKLMLC